jgi:hypothetical protein
MAYTHCIEVAEGRQASIDNKYQRSYTRVFLVRTSAATYGAAYAASHPSLPIIFSAHPDDVIARCVSIKPTQDQGDPLLWRITYEYSYNVDSGGGGEDPAIDEQQQGTDPADRVESPLSRPRDYQISTTTYPWAIMTDRLGNAILNTAEDPYLPALERIYGGALITVGLNSASSPSSAWIQAIGYVNSATYTLGTYAIGAGLAKLNSISANRVFENNVFYWRWSLVFEYRPLGWLAVIASNGLNEMPLIGGAKKKQRIMLEGGAYASTPVLLNEYGLRLNGPRDVGALNPSNPPYYQTFDIYPRVAFPSL